MNIYFYRLKMKWLSWRNPPAIVITRSGELTDRPQVHIRAQSLTGMQGIHTYPDNELGNAQATMYGQGLAKILARRLVDTR